MQSDLLLVKYNAVPFFANLYRKYKHPYFVFDKESVALVSTYNRVHTLASNSMQKNSASLWQSKALFSVIGKIRLFSHDLNRIFSYLQSIELHKINILGTSARYFSIHYRKHTMISAKH